MICQRPNSFIRNKVRFGFALVKANKQFEMMSYPNRTHGLSEGENTSRHRNELRTNFFLKNLASGGR